MIQVIVKKSSGAIQALLLVASFCLSPVVLSDNINATSNSGKKITLSKSVLKDKIKGAWAAQTIGVTYGAPVEFKYNSAMVPDNHTLPWYDGYLKKTYTEMAYLYDDIYMDLTFVQVLEDEGMDAPAQSFGDAFANADYTLWFANQLARYNILAGISPPQSGHWLNNPAADDIDFQIEADFAGIMNPGMVNSAAKISDTVGHVMNYGDGWYGGVFIAAMYSTAFVSDDIRQVVTEALKVIPKQSKFHQIITDVIRLHREIPDDWRSAWFEVHRKWAHTDLGPYGAFSAFNIDAKINAAWVVLGLLYGDGDFTRTLEIATKSGDDADCNPASAAGILGAMKGYNAIPAYWTQGLKEVESLDFAHTTISLNDVYKLSYKHALEMIRRGGGSIGKKSVTINVESPKTVPLEISFEGHYAKEKRNLVDFFKGGEKIKKSYSFDFDGIGFAVNGEAKKTGEEDYIFDAELYIDGKLVEKASWPTDYIKRRFYLFWRYQLPKGNHHVEIRVRNPSDKAEVVINNITLYDDTP